MRKVCQCGAVVWDGPGKLGRPSYGETIVCRQCDRDHSRQLPPVRRTAYLARRLYRRWEAYGLIGLRLHLRARGRRIWRRSDTELPGVAWLVMWRRAPWYDMWHMGRSRSAVARARKENWTRRMAEGIR